MTSKRLVWLALLLFGAGVLLVALSAATPWHSDPTAWSAGLEALRDQVHSSEAPDYDAASSAFDSLQLRYATSKWLYADLGYSSLAWAALILAVTVVRRERRGLTTRRWLPIVGATLLALALLLTGMLASAFQSVGRGMAPEWADTLAIPIFGAMASVMLLVPVALALTLSPVIFTRRRPAPLFALGQGWVGGFVASLIYLLPIAAAALLLGTVAEAGGWATSPAGGLMLWLFLNARATWLGVSPAKALP